MIYSLKPAIAIFLILFIGACAKNEQSLTTNKRAKLVTELISDGASCRVFKTRLDAPSIIDNEIESVYRDALKAGCIYKDI